MKLSYLNLTTTDPTINLATEQYVFEQLPKDRTYFMLWQNDNAIIIGKHQNTLAEINEKYVKENNISVVRRLSGGGAVYHDLGNLNFTFITDANKQANIDFHLFCQPIVKTLKSIGIHAEINGRNDITIDGKKFSGNSQLIRDGRVLHHGTILFQSDLTIVGKALQVNAEKIQASPRHHLLLHLHCRRYRLRRGLHRLRRHRHRHPAPLHHPPQPHRHRPLRRHRQASAHPHSRVPGLRRRVRARAEEVLPLLPPQPHQDPGLRYPPGAGLPHRHEGQEAGEGVHRRASYA